LVNEKCSKVGKLEGDYDKAISDYTEAIEYESRIIIKH